MKNIHVCLISDQTIPNILAIESFNSDELLLISTKQMESKGKSRHILECLSCRGFDYNSRHHKLIVPEDSLVECRRVLDNWITGREDSDFVVNLTGGTKIMSIAAYEFFKYYAAEMIYIPIGKNDYVKLFPRRGPEQPTPLPQRLNVNEYLKAYGLTPLNTRYLGQMANDAIDRKEMSNWIIGNYSKIKNFLTFIGGSLRSHRNDKKFFFKDTFEGASAEERNLMERMEISVSGNDLEKEMTKSEIQYLTGGWLEEYCFNEMSSLIGCGIDDVVIGLAIKNAKGTENEFDILFTKDNALYTVECKSLDQEADKKTEALYKVAALQKDFGLRVESFFVSTSPHFMKNGELQPSIAARAEHLNTKVIPPNDVVNFKKRIAEKLNIPFKTA